MSVLKKEHTWLLHKARTTTMLTSEQQSKNNRRKTDADASAPSANYNPVVEGADTAQCAAEVREMTNQGRMQGTSPER